MPSPVMKINNRAIARHLHRRGAHRLFGSVPLAHGHAASLEGDKLFIGGVSARLGIPGLFVGVIALVIAAYMGFSGGATEIAAPARITFSTPISRPIRSSWPLRWGR